MKRLLIFLTLFLIPVYSQAQRLPRLIFPTHYDLLFTPDLDQENFTGKEIISISVQQPTQTIVLNSMEIQFQRAEIEFASENPEKPKRLKADVQLDPKKEFAILKFSDRIPVGPAKLSIDYTGKLNRQLRGFYIGDPIESSSKRKYAASQGESTDIRRAFPSFDEPEMKATFNIQLILDQQDTAISNSPVLSDTPGPGRNQHTIRFAPTPRLSTYLVALVVGDFHCLKDQVEGVPLGICALQNRSSSGQFAMDVTKGVLTYLHDYYGIKYPFAKLDQIGIPDFSAGAMENAGAIIYRESALLADPKSASLIRRKAIASTISHEIAHMWFGDLVTMKWWNDIWLNEGFATWMSSKPLKKLHPKWRFDLQEMEQSTEAMNTDVLPSTRQIRANAETSREIDALFDSIAYQKTASLLRMIESYIGEEDFRTGVNDYLARHSFANAESFDFFEALATNSHSSADEVMNSFVNQPGIPILSVTTSCEKNNTLLKIEQKRFSEIESKASTASQKWILPVCFSSDHRDPQCQIVREKTQTLKFAGCFDRPIFLNKKGIGYFITAYPENVEKQIIKNAKELEETEQMVLARDEWYLILSGERPVGNFLDLSQLMRTSRNPAISEPMLKYLQYIDDYWATQRNREAYRKWVRSLLQPVSKEIGMNPAKGEPEEDRLFRSQIQRALAVTANDPDTNKDLQRMAHKYLRDRKSLDPEVITSVLSGAAANGDSKLYEELMGAYRSGGTPEEVRRFIEALAEFRDPALLERTMNFALTDAVRNQDRSRLMSAVIQNPAGSMMGWKFVKKHWPEIEKQVSDAQQLGLVRATSALCESESANDVKQFFAEHPVPGSDRNLSLSLERIAICVHAKSAQQKNLDRRL